MSRPSHWPIVEVTQDLIDQAIRSNSSHCMIADAIKATIPEARYVSVDLATIRFSLGDKRYIILTPRKNQEQLLRFDGGEEMTPWSFYLPRPVQTVQARVRKARTDLKAKAERVRKGDDHVPTKLGGITPPMGALAGGSLPGTTRSKAQVTTGAIRSFGLRGMGRA